MLPTELLKSLEIIGGEILLLKLCEDVYEKGDWPEDVTKVVMVLIEKKDTKRCEKYRTNSLSAQAAKILLRTGGYITG